MVVFHFAPMKKTTILKWVHYNYILTTVERIVPGDEISLNPELKGETAVLIQLTSRMEKSAFFRPPDYTYGSSVPHFSGSSLSELQIC